MRKKDYQIEIRVYEYGAEDKDGQPTEKLISLVPQMLGVDDGIFATLMRGASRISDELEKYEAKND